MKLFLALFISLSLMACGSSGGGSSSPAPGSTANPGSDTNTNTKLYAKWSNEQVNQGIKFTIALEFKKGIIISHITCGFANDPVTASVSSSANITNTTVEILETKNSKVSGKVAGNECTASVAPAKANYQIDELPNGTATLTIMANGQNYVYTRN